MKFMCLQRARACRPLLQVLLPDAGDDLLVLDQDQADVPAYGAEDDPETFSSED